MPSRMSASLALPKLMRISWSGFSPRRIVRIANFARHIEHVVFQRGPKTFDFTPAGTWRGNRAQK